MKRGKILLLFFLCLLWSLCTCIEVAAADTTTSGEELPTEEFHAFLESLPPELVEHLPPELFSNHQTDVAIGVEQMSRFSYLLTQALAALESRLGSCLQTLAILVGILLLSALCRAFSVSGSHRELQNAFSFCASLVLLSGLLSRGIQSLQRVEIFFSSLTNITATLLPLMAVLYSLGGNLTAATATSAGLSVYITLLEEWVGRTVLPFCAVCLLLSMLQSLHPSLRLGTLLGTVKKNYTTLLAFLMMLLLAMLSAQTVLGARSDTLLMRSAKFAAGNLIPVVGGSVAELLRSVSATVGYLRGTVGLCAVLLLLLTLLPTVVELLLVRLTWQIGAAVADLLGCDGEKKLMEEFASLHGYLLTAVCICASVLVLSLGLLIHTASAIG